jgi:hypothetical protein
MTTENQPHVVYRKGQTGGVVCLLPSYAAAHECWKSQHSVREPYLIATLGRVIDPATPIIDVNE